MTNLRAAICRSAHASRPPARRRTALLAAVLGCLALAGCQAVTNPVADGIPVRRLPPDVLAVPKSSYQPLALSLLRQKPPEYYRLGPGDILGIWIDDILGVAGQQIPVMTSEGPLPPAMGYPVLVQANGTIALPQVDPIKVEGLSPEQARDKVYRTYIEGGILRKERAPRIFVTLMRRRRYHVLVVRQESNSPSGNVTGGLFGIGSIGVASGTTGSGTGHVLDLPAYENDLMNALTRSGGLPGFGSADEVIIERGAYQDGMDPNAVARQLQQCPPGAAGAAGAAGTTEYGARRIRIPLRIRTGEAPPFRPEDIILQTGDILFIPARDAEIFYVGGLLFTGQYTLPRDYDLGVVEAIAVTRGSLVNGGQLSLNNFSGTSSQGGIGAPNPSMVSVIRRMPDGRQVTIAVDLNRALRDPRENLIIRKNDIMIMQFSPAEALARYFSQQFHLDFLGTIIRQADLTSTATLNVP